MLIRFEWVTRSVHGWGGPWPEPDVKWVRLGYRKGKTHAGLTWPAGAGTVATLPAAFRERERAVRHAAASGRVSMVGLQLDWLKFCK
jgi:hypothetical protein